MKIEVGDEVYLISEGYSQVDGTFKKKFFVLPDIVRYISVFDDGLPIVRGTRDDWYKTVNDVFPHTPEGKRQAEARVGELNE